MDAFESKDVKKMVLLSNDIRTATEKEHEILLNEVINNDTRSNYTVRNLNELNDSSYSANLKV